MRWSGIGAAAAALTATALAAQQASTNPAYVGGAATQAEDAQLTALLNDAYNTLRSDAFKANLKSLSTEFRTVFMRVEGDETTSKPVRNGSVGDLADVVSAKSPNRYVRVPVALVGGSRYYFALSGTTGDGVHASFTLGRANLGYWGSSDPVERSCAINTVAHEMSHLISSDATAFREDTQPIRDTNAGTRSGTNAVASYLVGTVAQCTWLQKQNHSPAVNIKECVKVFGHRGFNQLRCDQFKQNKEIKYRSDLYTEHVITD